nr:triple tyrosine motif-containing protein [Pedobacter sp. SYSU D00535]
MNTVDGKLLLGKHEGAFLLSETLASGFSGNKGYWNFLQFHHKKYNHPILLAGNYKGIDLFHYTASKYQFLASVKNFQESARFITIGNDHLIWASHPYKGVYKIDLSDLDNPKVKLYTKNAGLPSTFNNHVYKVKGRIVVCTEKGIYEYNRAKDKFEPSESFRNIFRHLYIRYLREDNEGNIWFIQDKSLGVCKISGKKAELVYLPELNGKLVSGFENINPINKNNILVGAQKGFYHVDFEKYIKSTNSVKVRFSLIKATGKTDSLLFGGYFGEVNEVKKQAAFPTVKYGLNSFHFEYSAILNKNQSNIEYSYYLEGFDKAWSAFSKKTEKDYTNLPYGDYVFKVKARNNFGIESEAATYKFSIAPPWYNTLVAYFCYFLLTVFLIYRLYKVQQKKFIHQKQRFQEEQKRLEYLHQLEMDKSEKEIIKLKNEKLETEIEAKNSELASIAMHLGQKAELLDKIKAELNKLNKHIVNEEQHADINKILRTLSNEEKADEGWEQFAMYFDKVHTNFLKDIKTAYPNLTPNDLRLSAYLKMNLSTKEIAQLMKISPRGVEISRYRLRKKLGISGDISLFEFFKDFKVSEEEAI